MIANIDRIDKMKRFPLSPHNLLIACPYGFSVDLI